MIPGMSAGGGISGTSSASSQGRNELASSHIFNFNKSDNMPIYVIGGALVLFAILGRK